MVATVGRIEASPGATNVIPGRVGFSLEFRSVERRQAQGGDRADQGRTRNASASSGGSEFAFEPFHETNTTACTPALQDLMADAIAVARLPSRSGCRPAPGTTRR